MTANNDSWLRGSLPEIITKRIVGECSSSVTDSNNLVISVFIIYSFKGSFAFVTEIVTNISSVTFKFYQKYTNPKFEEQNLEERFIETVPKTQGHGWFNWYEYNSISLEAIIYVKYYFIVNVITFVAAIIGRAADFMANLTFIYLYFSGKNCKSLPETRR